MVATDSLFKKTCTLSRNMAKKDSAETHDKFFYNFLYLRLSFFHHR